MIIARQSTARTVTVGPVLDADGVAVTDGVVGDFKLSKNGGAPAGLNGSATLTHRNTGHYSLALTASDLDTVGQAEIVIDDTTNACPMKEITVIEEAVYDAMFAASALGYVANAPVRLADAVTHGGTTAVLQLDHIALSAASGAALDIAGPIGVRVISSVDEGLLIEGWTQAVHLKGDRGSGGANAYQIEAGTGIGFSCIGGANFRDVDGINYVTFGDISGYGIAVNGTTADVFLTNSTAPTLKAAILTAGAINSAVAPNLDAAVTTRAVAGDAMTLANDAITTAAIADGAITDAKITAPAETAGRPTGVLAMLRRVFEWRSNKRIRTRSTGAVQLRDAADSADLETQTQSTAGSVGSEIDSQTKGV